MKTKHVWTTVEEQIVKDYYITHGVRQTLSLLPTKTRGSLQNKVRALGLKMTKEQWCKINLIGQNGIRKHGAKLSLFYNIQDPQIAYILGFIWADGHIPKKRQWEVKFTNALEDINELKSVFDFCGDWSYHELKRVKNRKRIMRVQIFHGEFCKYLISLNYVLKSGGNPSKVLDIIPEHLKHYWWRGYLDGDGCIPKQPHDYKLVFCSTYDQDWTFLSALDPNYQIGLLKRKDGHASQGRIVGGKENVTRVLKYIYQGYERDKIGLSRKYDIYKNKYLTT